MGVGLGALPDNADIFIGPARAAALIDQGALVIDARGRKATAPFLPRSIALDWLDYRDGWLREGRLESNLDELDRSLAALGVSDQRPVVVYGAMKQGWGEEGRIWWMLRYLGVPNVYILDGGIDAWRAEHRSTSDRHLQESKPGRLKHHVLPELRADHQSVDRARRDQKFLVLDTREASEFAGETPYHSSRGGHVPGARSMPWKSLIGADGRLLNKAEIRQRLAKLGASPQTPVIAYCTGGVRSAFVTAALIHAGFDRVANYDGSWWDWASRNDLPVEK